MNKNNLNKNNNNYQLINKIKLEKVFIIIKMKMSFLESHKIYKIRIM